MDLVIKSVVKCLSVNSFFSHIGPSSLTKDALAKHDAALQDADGDIPMSESDAQTVSAKTFSTWATNWTDCTNATFNRVHRYWASNSALHKEVCNINYCGSPGLNFTILSISYFLFTTLIKSLCPRVDFHSKKPTKFACSLLGSLITFFVILCSLTRGCYHYTLKSYQILNLIFKCF